jgi:hypothetical protein
MNNRKERMVERLQGTSKKAEIKNDETLGKNTHLKLSHNRTKGEVCSCSFLNDLVSLE